MKPTFQKSSIWTDESGIEIPVNRISKAENLRERLSEKVLKAAMKVNEQLYNLKAIISNANDAVMREIAKENRHLEKATRWGKGNHTWYNFDRSVKIEVNINEMIRFDEAKISAARELFDNFIDRNVTGTDDIVRQLINSAFSNTKGGLDSKKVLSLLKYRTRIKDKSFHAALDLIEQSISRPDSKKYYRVWVKNEEGQYENVDLNFSSISS